MKERLKKGDVLVGSWINSGSPMVAELMAQTGFDFLTIDMEHSAVNLPQAQILFQAIRSGNPECVAVVRSRGHEYSEIKQLLDAGAEGVICPLINSAKDAQELITGVKYPPLGRRGVGFCRDNAYGMNLENRILTANNNTIVCVQIEHIEAVRNIEEILSVEGLDAVFVGPYDLSASLGIPGQFNNSKYLETKQMILDACVNKSIAVGVHVIHPDVQEVERAVTEGYRLIAFSLDITIISETCVNALHEIKNIINKY